MLLTSHDYISHHIPYNNCVVHSESINRKMRVTAHSNLRRDCLHNILLSLLVLHVGICQAQTSSSSVAIAVPISFAVIAVLLCVYFWICFCFRWTQTPPHGASANAQHTPYVYNQRPYYSGDAQPSSYPVQGYVLPSTTPSNPPQTQQAYPGPGQGYVTPSTVTAPYSAPPATPGAASHTVPRVSEPVSLPEATPHQGDAPPGYVEAVAMKTVDNAGQDIQQTVSLPEATLHQGDHALPGYAEAVGMKTVDITGQDT